MPFFRHSRRVFKSGCEIRLRGPNLGMGDRGGGFMDVRYLVDESGEQIGVVLDPERYRALIEAEEELEDIMASRVYDEAVAEIERGQEKPVPLEEALPRIEAEREELRRRGEL